MACLLGYFCTLLSRPESFLYLTWRERVIFGMGGGYSRVEGYTATACDLRCNTPKMFSQYLQDFCRFLLLLTLKRRIIAREITSVPG